MGGITPAIDAQTTGTSPDDTAPPPSAPPPDRAAPAGPGAGRVGLVLTGLLLALFLAASAQTVAVSALAAAVGDLRGHGPGRGADGRATWAITGHLLAATVALPLHGRLGDRYGRKPLLLLAIAVFVVASALAGWSRTTGQFTVLHAVQGLGAGGVLIGAQALVADLVPGRRRARHIGAVAAAIGAGTATGPLLGAAVTEHLSWRWCFWAGAALGLLALAVVTCAPRLPKPAVRGRLDVLGTLLFTAAGTCLLLLAAWGGTRYAWDSRVALGLACGAAGTLLLFTVVEHYAPEPLIPLRLFRDPAFLVTAVAGAAVGAALSVVPACLPAYLRVVEGAGAVEAGLVLPPLAGALAVAGVVSGLLSARTGHSTVHAVTGGAVAVVGMWLLSRVEPGTPPLHAAVWAAVLGAGLGLVLPVLILTAQNAVPPGDVGTATGVHTFFRLLGGAAGAAVAGTVIGARLPAPTEAAPGPSPAGGPWAVTAEAVRAVPPALRDGHLQAYADGAPRALLLLVPVLAAGLLALFLLRERPPVARPAGGAAVPPARGPGSATAPAHPATAATPPAAPSPPVPAPAPASAGKPEPARTAPVPAGAARTAPVQAGAARTTNATAPAAAAAPAVPVCGTVRHHDGSWVAHAALTLVDAHGRQVGRGASGEGGRYALGVPGPGAYVLIAAAGGHRPQAVPVTVADRPVQLDVVLGGAGRLTGTVVAPDGSPVRDAAVTLTDVRGEVVAGARTERDGSYAVGGLVAGEYTLAANAPAFRPTALPVTVRPAGETRQDIELVGAATLRGTVRTPGGRPVEEARVILLDGAGNVVGSLTTGADGVFGFTELVSGDYTVIASGYPPVATVLKVAGGARTDRDLRLGHGD
ncbi:MFS transporter [Streptomyces sp. NPDC047928]|uniref:MFS transporter n=1 Tax=unclassified Streptomyces TaxID=2593676 RepID=UPI00371BD5BF